MRVSHLISSLSVDFRGRFFGGGHIVQFRLGIRVAEYFGMELGGDI